MDLEFHQLDRRYEDLRLRRPERERSLLASLAEQGQQVPIVVVSQRRLVSGHRRLQAVYAASSAWARTRCVPRFGTWSRVRPCCWTGVSAAHRGSHSWSKAGCWRRYAAKG